MTQRTKPCREPIAVGRRIARRRRRTAHSLLELIVASSLVSIVVATSVTLMRESLRLSDDSETRNLLTTLAVSKLEQQLTLVASSFPEGAETGDFAADGYGDVKYSVTRSAQVADGGIPGKLMAVAITAWNDTNGNGDADSGEPQVNLRTKLAWITAWQL